MSESFLKTFQHFCWPLLKYLDYSKYCWNSDVQWSQFQNTKAVCIDVFIIHWNFKFYSPCSLFEKSHRNFFWNSSEYNIVDKFFVEPQYYTLQNVSSNTSRRVFTDFRIRQVPYVDSRGSLDGSTPHISTHKNKRYWH